MNSIERIKKVVNFSKPDYVPVIAQVFGHAAVLANVPIKKYLQDGELLAQCQIEAWKRYRYDAVFALMDVCVETEALGSVLEFRENDYPGIKKYAMANVSELESFSIPNPNKAGRMPELLRAAKILRGEVGDEVLVVSCVLGPMTITIQLLGVETALYLAIDDPEKFSQVLDFSADVCLKFAIEQIKAGAHLPVIFEPAGSPAIVPYQFFREFISPRLKKIFLELKEAGSAANWLHIAGPTIKILPYYASIGVDIANFDYYVGPLEAQKALPKTCLDGNINPLSFVIQTPNEILAESQNLLGLFEERGGYILSSGCEIPLEAKPENIEAFISSVGKKSGN